MEDVGQFSGHLAYFMDIWYIFSHVLVHFTRFGMLSGNPGNPRLE
jgi:hypothetical protein